MKPIQRGLTTVAIASAIAVGVAASLSQQSVAQTAIPSGEYHRFSPSTLTVDPETAAPESSAPTVGTQAVTPEPPSRGTFREAPAAFDNRTNGFDPQGPAFDNIDEDTVVPLRSFNDNRFIFEEF